MINIDDNSHPTTACHSQYHTVSHTTRKGVAVLLGHDAVIFKYQGLFAAHKTEGLVILKILELAYIELPNHDNMNISPL